MKLHVVASMVSLLCKDGVFTWRMPTFVNHNYMHKHPRILPKLTLPDHALFAVFDGHGGSYAAEYAGINFCRVLSRQEKFVQYATFVQERNSKKGVPTATRRNMHSIYVKEKNSWREPWSMPLSRVIAKFYLPCRERPNQKLMLPIMNQCTTYTTATATDGTDATADVVAANTCSTTAQ